VVARFVRSVVGISVIYRFPLANSLNNRYLQFNSLKCLLPTFFIGVSTWRQRLVVKNLVLQAAGAFAVTVARRKWLKMSSDQGQLVIYLLIVLSYAVVL